MIDAMSPPPSVGSDSTFDHDLTAVLLESQRLGFLGDRDVVDAATHARSFVDALVDVRGRVLDMGAGGGLPGLVIAHDRSDLDLVLVDRREKRIDFLRRVVRRLGWSDRVTVRHADIADVIGDERSHFDAVVARGFGPPDVTIGFASRLVAAGGRVVISEPPTGQRWTDESVPSPLERIAHPDARVAVFERHEADVSRET